MVGAVSAQRKNVAMSFEKILDEILTLYCIVIAAKNFLVKFSQQLTVTRAKSNGIDSVITHSNYLLVK